MDENKDDYIYNLTYRVKLPDTPLLDKASDEKFLYYYTIENFEKTKAFLNLHDGNLNMKEYFLFTSVQRFFHYMTPVVLLFSYRRFRIKKNNSILKSTLKSVPITLIYFAGFVYGFSGSQYRTYYNFIKNDFMKEETDDDLGKYIEFQEKYKNLITETSN